MREVDDGEERVARRLDEDEHRVVADRSFERLGFREVDRRRLDAEAAEHRDERGRPRVDALLGDDVVARLQQGERHGRDGTHARRGHHRAIGAFECGDNLGELGVVRRPVADVEVVGEALGRGLEERCVALGGERRGLRDRRRHRTAACLVVGVDDVGAGLALRWIGHGS